jgi:hypothetical protein
MKLSQLSAKPQLTKFILDDEETVKEYGEPIEFYMLDRQPLDVFMKLANIIGSDNTKMIEMVKDLILDEKGKPIITQEVTLPAPLMIRVMTFVIETLGKR